MYNNSSFFFHKRFSDFTLDTLINFDAYLKSNILTFFFILFNFWSFVNFLEL